MTLALLLVERAAVLVVAGVVARTLAACAWSAHVRGVARVRAAQR